MKILNFVKLFGGVMLVGAASVSSFGQASYTADGPGTYIAVGGTFSAYESDYGKRLMGGPTVFVDGNLYRRIGIEAKASWLNYHTDDGTKEQTYLIGPKISLKGRTVRPYAKLLAGRGEFEFPFGYAHGSYFVAAPGAGLDWRVSRSRLSIRVIDFEYQIWPGFSYGPLHPYGASMGLSWRVY